MSVRNELETLLSVSQGTTEDYGDYILRILEEINAVEDSIFNTMTKDTIDWVNDGILAYNGNQPIPEFPIVQLKVGPERLYKHIVETDSLVGKSIKAETITIPDVVSLPEIETEIQENIGNIEESIPDIVSDEEMLNEEFRKQEDVLFNNSDILEKQINNSDVPEKKKRGRPKGTKNKEDKLPNKTTITESEFTENEPFHFEIGASDIPVKKKRGRKPGTKNKTKDTQLVVEDFTERVMGVGIMDRETIEEHSEEETGDSASATVIEATENKYPLSVQTDEEISIYEETLAVIEDITNNPTKYGLKDLCTPQKPQKPLDLFRILVCQNHDRPFEEIFKLAENQSIDIKKSTALVTCSQIKATINTLKNLGMLKEFLLAPPIMPVNLEEDEIAKLYTTNYDPSEE